MNREVIKKYRKEFDAWLGGATIQYLDGGWWIDDDHPFDYGAFEYRIKPEPREWWINETIQCVHPSSAIYEPQNAMKNGFVKVREVIE